MAIKNNLYFRVALRLLYTIDLEAHPDVDDEDGEVTIFFLGTAVFTLFSVFAIFALSDSFLTSSGAFLPPKKSLYAPHAATKRRTIQKKPQKFLPDDLR